MEDKVNALLHSLKEGDYSEDQAGLLIFAMLSAIAKCLAVIADKMPEMIWEEDE